MAATHTVNLGLNKPDRQDFVSVVNDINDNMDAIDSAVGALSQLPTIEKSNLVGSISEVSDSLTALGTTVAAIGTVESNSATANSVNANNNTAYTGCSITLSPGKWIIIGHCTIGSCVSGSRQGMTVATSNVAGSYNVDLYDLKYQSVTATLNQYYSVAGMAFPTSNTTYYAMFFNGNVSTNVTSSLYAIKIA